MIWIERRGRMVNTSEFKYRPGNHLSQGFSWFFSVPSGTIWSSALKLGHDRFLPPPFQFVIQLSHFHSTLYNLSLKSVIKLQTRDVGIIALHLTATVFRRSSLSSVSKKWPKTLLEHIAQQMYSWLQQWPGWCGMMKTFGMSLCSIISVHLSGLVKLNTFRPVFVARVFWISCNKSLLLII
jgi:hypothetical protein